ncbi:hypothetical protein IWT25_02173 [Secundilactobacillus pentosiphilus]|uniref:Uncharacterized protein n=1 Tax=Secundilactobacillus pentosiphilus TaxID=1714682 RepID=A0A1Z5IYV7_9LACO|nr:hypothetical protein [Secundilactobacillus pentosiphilus]GAX06826.1 hypothetical protein IWT25_02173 [Secundilactobacillus pentosiphilus]
MKTSEFIKKIRELGFKAKVKKANGIFVFGSGDYWDWFVYVGSETVSDIETNGDNLSGADDNYAKAVKLAVDYAFTPINEREDEPKFRVAIRPSYYKDMKYYYLDLLEAGYANETGKKLEPIADELGKEFTPKSYKGFLEDYPEWRPFLPDYDPDNLDVFIPVPVEEDK